MAVYNNAEVSGEFFTQTPIGVMEEGVCVDLIFVDYHPTNPMTPGNLP